MAEDGDPETDERKSRPVRCKFVERAMEIVNRLGCLVSVVFLRNKMIIDTQERIGLELTTSPRFSSFSISKS